MSKKKTLILNAYWDGEYIRGKDNITFNYGKQQFEIMRGEKVLIIINRDEFEWMKAVMEESGK